MGDIIDTADEAASVSARKADSDSAIGCVGGAVAVAVTIGGIVLSNPWVAAGGAAAGFGIIGVTSVKHSLDLMKLETDKKVADTTWTYGLLMAAEERANATPPVSAKPTPAAVAS